VEKRAVLLAAALGLAALMSGCSRETTVSAENPPAGTYTPSNPPGPQPAVTASPAAPEPVSPAAGTPEASAGEHVQVLRVKNVLMTSKQPLRARTIQVTFENGAIRLRGTVPNAGQKSTAERLAKQPIGETPVINHLKVGK